jgi:hypothetical protein
MLSGAQTRCRYRLCQTQLLKATCGWLFSIDRLHVVETTARTAIHPGCATTPPSMLLH